MAEKNIPSGRTRNQGTVDPSQDVLRRVQGGGVLGQQRLEGGRPEGGAQIVAADVGHHVIRDAVPRRNDIVEIAARPEHLAEIYLETGVRELLGRGISICCVSASRRILSACNSATDS